MNKIIIIALILLMAGCVDFVNGNNRYVYKNITGLDEEEFHSKVKAHMEDGWSVKSTDVKIVKDNYLNPITAVYIAKLYRVEFIKNKQEK